mmetsp:Transcript_22910/g.77443  ORF Transcript_22910/g.77443 Transcript_22910/m.77443 type:complete len:282 (+) Transcript_22910:554-1399(+)
MRVHVPLESVGVVRGVGQPLIPETCEFELRDFLHREHPRREREIRDRVERLPQRQRLLGELLERRSRARAGRARDRRELGEDAARVCEQLVAVVADEHLVEGLDLDVQLVQHLAKALRHGAEADLGCGLDGVERVERRHAGHRGSTPRVDSAHALVKAGHRVRQIVVGVSVDDSAAGTVVDVDLDARGDAAAARDIGAGRDSPRAAGAVAVADEVEVLSRHGVSRRHLVRGRAVQAPSRPVAHLQPLDTPLLFPILPVGAGVSRHLHAAPRQHHVDAVAFP